MKIKSLISSLTLLSLFVIFGSSCKKLVHQNIQAASASSLAIRSYNDVFNQINAAVSSEAALDEMTSATWFLQGSVCADVSLTPIGTSFPKTLTIDYGTSCVGPDGVTRSGKIVAVFSGNFRSEGTSINVSFDNFKRANYALAGTDSITNNGMDGDGNPIFSEVIRDVVITWDSDEILWSADLNRTWIAGDTTNFSTDTVGGTLGLAGLDDDVFSLLGTGSGNDANTHPYSVEVSRSLILPTNCRFITDGLLMVTPTNFNEGVIDYGMGDCDAQATIEIDGEVFNFIMR